MILHVDAKATGLRRCYSSGLIPLVSFVQRFAVTLNSDGNLGPDVSSISSLVRRVSVDSAGRIAIVTDGFDCAQQDFDTPASLIRILGNGQPDASFRQSSFRRGLYAPSARPDIIAIQPNNKIIFVLADTYTNAFNKMSRLNADGTTDSSFQADIKGLDAPVGPAAVQPDGKLVFLTSTNRLIRLNVNGSQD